MDDTISHIFQQKGLIPLAAPPDPSLCRLQGLVVQRPDKTVPTLISIKWISVGKTNWIVI